MTDSTDSTSANHQEVVKRLASNMVRLEGALEQTLQALKKRGFQLSTDLGGMLRSVQTDVDTLQKNMKNVLEKQHQLQELVRTSALINSSLELDQVLSEVMDTVITLTGAERAYLMLLDKQTGELSIRNARNWDRESLAEPEVVFSRGVINAAIEQGKPILTTNAQSDVRFQQMQSVFNHALRSIICIPLVLRGVTIGVLYADNRIGQGIFSQDSVSLLTAFANQSAIAIENARNFGKVKADLDVAKAAVQTLQIRLDQKKLQDELGEITETEYFQKLQSLARDMRTSSRRSIRLSDVKSTGEKG